MKYNLQYFADGGEFDIEVDVVTDAAKTMEDAGKEIEQSTEVINEAVKEVADTSDQQAAEDLGQVTTEITSNGEKLTSAISGLVGLASSVLGIVTQNSGAFSGEIQGWIATAKHVMTGIPAAYTAEGASQGMDTVKSAGQEMLQSGIKISQYSRGLVDESVNMLVAGGKMVKGLTGKSPQELVDKGIGTIATLFKVPQAGSVITNIIGAGINGLKFLGGVL